MSLLRRLSLALCGLLFACDRAPEAARDLGSAGPDMSQPLELCQPPEPSICNPANPGSVVRGVVRFEPAHFQSGQAVTLVVLLKHQVIAVASEATTGGHMHAYKSFDVDDVASGKVEFSIDLCELGTAMWSEENCGFNLITILDEDGSNNPRRGAPAWAAQAGELVKMTPLSISCRSGSPCLDIVADCVDGDACTTFEPPVDCTCAAERCPSDDALCVAPTHH